MQEKQLSPSLGKQTFYALTRSDIAKFTGHGSDNFLDDFDKADEEERRHSLLQYPNEIMRIPQLRESGYWQFLTTQQLWLHSPINGSVERKQIVSFIFGRLNLKNFSMNLAVIRSQESTTISEHVKQLLSVI